MSTIKPSVADRFADHIPFHRPLAEIERIAAGMGSSPTDDGLVEMIICRPAMYQRRVLAEGMLDDAGASRGQLGEQTRSYARWRAGPAPADHHHE